MNPRYVDYDLQPVDLLTWGALFESPDRPRVVTAVGNREVSTVWIGMNLRLGYGPPMWFETMVFPAGTHQRRYGTWAEAKAGHDQVVAEVEREDEVIEAALKAEQSNGEQGG